MTARTVFGTVAIASGVAVLALDVSDYLAIVIVAAVVLALFVGIDLVQGHQERVAEDRAQVARIIDRQETSR